MSLTPIEQQRLKDALEAAWAVPFVDDIGGFVWEAIFHYVKELAIPNRLTIEIAQQARSSKRLFDVIDFTSKIGWSLKALQLEKRSLVANLGFEFVIQRADIFKKSKILGFEIELSKESDPNNLGQAIITHWNNKVTADSTFQAINDRRLGILLKNKDRTEYVYMEQPLEILDNNDFDWRWTDTSKTGLQALRKTDQRVFLRWYANQKQLFQTLTIPLDPIKIEITPKRLPIKDFVERISDLL
jgi:hypothetical protein